MPPRFLVTGFSPDASLVHLGPEEAAHLSRVLRLGPGSEVAVFDGEGNEFLATVVSVSRDKVSVRPLRPLVSTPESTVPITLAQAVLKGDKMDDVVRDASMLGVVALQPLLTARTDVLAAVLRRGRRRERWRRIAIASVKQCGRAVVPRIHEPVTLPVCIARHTTGLRLILVEPSADTDARRASTRLREMPAPKSALVLVGPEGGWEEGELSIARASGFQPVTLGRRTLRADAVAVAALSILQFLWDDL
jgi:16S rRNA (uracil1498-N3)-methyltransferase